jgi:iron complex outermembrane receptor protein
LTVNAGLREATAEDDDLLTGFSSDDTEVASEVGLSFFTENDVRLFIRNAESYRFANADENGLTLLPAGEFLNPQTSESLETGIEFDNGQWATKVLVYDMDIDDEIYYDAFLFANINLPSSNRKGVIMEGHVNVTPDVTLATNYTYTDAAVTSGSFKGNAVPFVAENKGTVSATFHLNESLLFYIETIYTGSMYSADDDTNTAGKVSSYTLTNANLQWQQGNLHTGLRINNVFGEEYATLISHPWDYQYPAAERVIEATMGYDF